MAPSINSTSMSGRQGTYLFLGVFVVAVTLRLLFFNGPFGSDDLVYLARAVQIAQGDWSSSDYVGSLRYGFNIPAGFLIYLFGVSLTAANLWPLFCSLTEIAAVYVFAFKLWGARAAFYAALILAFIPIHIAVATRIHADPVVSCFLTLSFILFYLAEERQVPWLYFLVGLALGAVFWAKQIVVVITLFALAFYPLLWRRLNWRWAYVIAGGLTMLFAHFALMYFIVGDPFHVFKVMTSPISVEGYGEDAVGYYFKYLFLDIKHTWLVGVIAAVAILLIPFRRLREGRTDPGLAYIAFWLLTLLGILSFMPISLDPLLFIMKQSNYMTLFLAPMAMLAGYQVARAPRWLGLGILSLVLGGGWLLAGLEQQAYQVFTSNSKAAVSFAKAHPGVPIVGSTNNANIASVYAIVENNPALTQQFRYLSEMPRITTAPGSAVPSVPGYAVLDQETMGWGANAVNLEKPPRCWEETQRLTPTGFGWGLHLVRNGVSIAKTLPDSIQVRIMPPLQKLAWPKPAHVYRVNLADFWCEAAI